MTAAKWLQFLEHVQMRWPNLPVRHAKVPEDLRRMLREFGVSPRRVERELQVALTGIRPLTLINFSIVFGMVVMPFTYYPILRAAGDASLLGRHANGHVYSAVAWFFFVLVTIAATAAIPLAVLTHNGHP